jgi:uncharacterized protein
MKIKEAVIKSLEDIKKLTNYLEVYTHIINNKYYEFKEAKTPQSTISAALGDFIRKGDTRVKRIKEKDGSYRYYLTKNENTLGLDLLLEPEALYLVKPKKSKVQIQGYEERSLHLLLSSYLKSQNIFSKTIFHEQSRTGVDSNQIWTHPDMVGIVFLKLRSVVSQNFIKTVNRSETFNLSSYEIKKEINNDTELKKAYFQAVSNSSWANYGYLAAFEISNSLKEEMERLNQAFGIGIIELSSKVFQSKTLYPAKYKEIDYKTMDKLCKMNNDFERFIDQIERLMTATEKYYKPTEKELEEFCDKFLVDDTSIEKYCSEKNIPNDPEDE